MNVAGIELAPPITNPQGQTRPLSVLPAQHLAGFLSLLNGLIDPTGTGTRGRRLAVRRAAGLPHCHQPQKDKWKRPRAQQTAMFRPRSLSCHAAPESPGRQPDSNGRDPRQAGVIRSQLPASFRSERRTIGQPVASRASGQPILRPAPRARTILPHRCVTLRSLCG